MPNYFGQRRLEKIFWNYLSDRPELSQSIKNSMKEYGYLMQYSKYRGSEWLEIGEYFDEVSYGFKLYATGKSNKRVTMYETQTVYDDTDDEEHTIYNKGVHAWYNEDFYPYGGETRLCIMNIYKPTLKQGETVTVYQSEDGEEFALKPMYFFDQQVTVYECILPPVYHIRRYFDFEYEFDIFPDIRGGTAIKIVNQGGVPAIKYSYTSQSEYPGTIYNDVFLSVKLSQPKQQQNTELLDLTEEHNISRK